jgi:predicted CoA-binding protein
MLEQESFWNAGSFAVITDRTKPAMKWAVDELTKRGRKVYVVDMSGKPDKGTLQDISELPPGVDCAVVGVTKINPADAMESLEKKGIKKFWIHWRTETPEVKIRCSGSQMQCITGKCPMMYLAHGLNIHTMHKSIAKIMGKY